MGGTAEKRVVVFVDYQNTYRSARDAFHDHSVDPRWLGQIIQWPSVCCLSA